MLLSQNKFVSFGYRWFVERISDGGLRVEAEQLKNKMLYAADVLAEDIPRVSKELCSDVESFESMITAAVGGKECVISAQVLCREKDLDLLICYEPQDGFFKKNFNIILAKQERSDLARLESIILDLQDELLRATPVGTIQAYAGTTAPKGWLVCDGRELKVSNPDYASLFKAIKYTWGGHPHNGTFRIPDLSNGSYPIGAHKSDQNSVFMSDYEKRPEQTNATTSITTESSTTTPPIPTSSSSSSSGRLEVGQYRSSTHITDEKQQLQPHTTPVVAVVNYIIKY